MNYPNQAELRSANAAETLRVLVKSLSRLLGSKFFASALAIVLVFGVSLPFVQAQEGRLFREKVHGPSLEKRLPASQPTAA